MNMLPNRSVIFPAVLAVSLFLTLLPARAQDADGCVNDPDCPDGTVCLGSQCVRAGDQDIDRTEEETEAVEGETAEEDGEDSAVLCGKDEDCGKGESCRPEGLCVPVNCTTDADCLYERYYCREGGVCLPRACTYDLDCLDMEICLNQACIPDPSTYVEGGVSNCSGTSFSSVWEQLTAVLIGGLLLLWLRIRRRQAASNPERDRG